MDNRYGSKGKYSSQEYAKIIMDKYGPEEGKKILAKLRAIEMQNEGYSRVALEKLDEAMKKKPLSEAEAKAMGLVEDVNGAPVIQETKKMYPKGKYTESTITGDEFLKKIAKSKAAKKALKSIPIIGGLAAGLATGDVEAAIPILGEADALGPRKGDEGYDIENPEPKFKRLKDKMRK